MKVAAIQMVSTPDLHANLTSARRLIAEAASQGARLVSLPEYFCLMGRSDADKLAAAEAGGDTAAPIQAMLSQTARAHGLWLVGGTLPLRSSNPARARNACLVFGPDGKLAARYDKIHLFRFSTDSEDYDEGRTLERGDTPTTVQADPLKVGLSICYDLRFPELYRALSSAPGAGPCDLLRVPAAFTYTTGKAHWELLLRARAVENQCYVIAAAQGGKHENGRRTWGHSMIVDPWGQVLSVLPEGEGVVVAEVDAQRLADVRAQLPALSHRVL